MGSSFFFSMYDSEVLTNIGPMPILSSWLSHLYLQHITVRIDGWMDGLIILVFYRSFLIPFLLNLGQDDYNKEKRFTQCT